MVSCTTVVAMCSYLRVVICVVVISGGYLELLVSGYMSAPRMSPFSACWAPKCAGTQLWYPTSRKKRARYGAPPVLLRRLSLVGGLCFRAGVSLWRRLCRRSFRRDYVLLSGRAW